LEFDDAAAQVHPLVLAAHKVHFDAPAFGVEKGLVTKAVEVEIRAKLAVNPRQQVEVELRGDASRIVISRVENSDILDQVDSDDKGGTRSEHARRMLQKSRGLLRVEIADGRARKKPGAGKARNSTWQLERFGEVGGNGDHLEARVIAPELRCFAQEHFR